MVSEGIFINGEKVTFNPENILNGDVSAYTEAIGEATQDWLDEHLEPGGSVPIDDTLSIAGSAADAKAAGDAITELNTQLSAEELRAKAEEARIEDLFTQPVEEAVSDWLDDHPEATTTIDFNIVTKIHNTVQDMISDMRLKNGDTVITNGYNTLNDGGGCFYNITSSKQRACAIGLMNGLFANLAGDCLTNRQIGIFSGDNGQDAICEYIADTSFSELIIIDPLVVQKKTTGNAIDNIELIKIRRNDFILRFEGNGSFSLITNGEDYYRIIAIAGCDNVRIIKPVIAGDNDTIGITSGEYGHGINIRSGTNITLESPTISKCFGDGIAIGAGSNHIKLVGVCRIDSVRRNGISIGHSDDVYIENVYATNILGTNPKCAVDIEANTNTEDTTNIRIDKIYAYNCGGAIDIMHVGNHVSALIGVVIAKRCTNRALGCGYIINHDANQSDTTPINENNVILVSSIVAIDMADVIITLVNLSKSKTSKVIIESVNCINYSQNTGASNGNAIVAYNYQNTDYIMNGVGRFTVNRISSDAENIRYLTMYRATATTFNFDDVHLMCEIPTTIQPYTNVNNLDNSAILHTPRPHDFGPIGGSTLKTFASTLLNAVHDYSAGFYNIYGSSNYFGYFTGFARTLNQTLFISVVVGSHNLYIKGTTSNYNVYDNGQELE